MANAVIEGKQGEILEASQEESSSEEQEAVAEPTSIEEVVAEESAE